MNQSVAQKKIIELSDEERIYLKDHIDDFFLHMKTHMENVNSLLGLMSERLAVLDPVFKDMISGAQNGNDTKTKLN